MGKQLIDVGTVNDPTTGDSLREGAVKINENTTELYDSKLNSVNVGEPIGANALSNAVSILQAEYDAGTPIPTTLYVITNA